MSNCQDITTLSDTIFIGGSTQYFEYTIYNSETGNPINISDLTLKFTLNSAYGQSNFEPIVITASKKDSYTFRVEVPKESTQDLKGFYLQQPVLTDYLEDEFKPAQGSIVVLQSNE